MDKAQVTMEKEKMSGVPLIGDMIVLSAVKDKRTGMEGKVKPLFDCIEALETAVDSLKGFAETADEDREYAEKCLQALAKMQAGLLDICRRKIEQRSQLSPPGMGGMMEEPDLGTSEEAEPVV